MGKNKNLVNQNITYGRMFNMGEYHRFFIPAGVNKRLYPEDYQQKHILEKYEHGIDDIRQIVTLTQKFTKNIRDLQRHWKEKIQEQWEKESILYKELATSKSLDSELPKNWKDVYENNEQMKKLLENWEKVLNNFTIKSKEKNKDTEDEFKWFAKILSSQEFSTLFSSTVRKTSLFSTALSKFLGVPKKEAREILKKSLINDSNEVLNSNFNLREEVGEVFIKKCNDLFLNKEVNNEIKNEVASLLESFFYNNYSKDKKRIPSYEVAKKKFKEETTNLIKDLSTQFERAGLKVDNDTFNISIEKNDGKMIIFTIVNGEEGLFATIKKNSEKVGKELFILSIIKTLETLFNGKNNIEIHTGWGQVEKVEKKNIKENDIKIFLEEIHFSPSKQLLTEEEIWGMLSKKDFQPLIGVLGELKTSLKNKSIITGFDQDEKIITDSKGIQKSISLGESFSDAYSETETSKIKYGYNVKHFVSKFTSTTISIYDKEEGFSLSSNAIYRYFSEKEATLLRFIDYNFNTIQKLCGKIPVSEKKIKNLYDAAASYNLNNFIRASSAANVEYVNYFFDINNLYIPTSYLYYLIYKQINSQSFFEINFNPAGLNIITQKQILENRESEENMNKFIDTRLISNIGHIRSSKIIFKGLTINLKDKLP